LEIARSSGATDGRSRRSGHRRSFNTDRLYYFGVLALSRSKSKLDCTTHQFCNPGLQNDRRQQSHHR
jgi:hypothetical protein